MKKLIKYIFIIIAPYLLLSLLYRRLFSYNKNIDINDITLNQLILYVYLCLIFFVLIIFTIYRRCNKNSKYNIFTDWYLALSEQYYIALQTIENFIIEKILKKLNINPSKLLPKIVNNVKKYKINIKYIYLILIIPKIIVVIVFIIEIMLFNKLKYFYLVLCILLVPAIINYILYAIKEQYNKGLNRIKIYIDVLYKDSEDPKKVLTEVKNNILVLLTFSLEDYINNKLLFKNQDKYILALSLYTFESVENAYKINVKTTLAKYSNYIDLLIDSKFVFYFVDQYRNHYDFYINLFCYVIYFIGWFYIVLHYFY